MTVNTAFILCKFVNSKIFLWLQISPGSLRMAGAKNMVAAAQLSKIRDE